MTSNKCIFQRVEFAGHFTSSYSWSYSIKFHFYYLYGWKNIQRTKTIGSKHSGQCEKITNGPYNDDSSHFFACVSGDVSFLSLDGRRVSLIATLIFSLRICPMWQMVGHPCVGPWSSIPTLPCILKENFAGQSRENAIFQFKIWWMIGLNVDQLASYVSESQRPVT